MVDLIINGKNARELCGICTTSNTLGALLAPPPLKECIQNSSRLEDGVRFTETKPFYASREITLELQMVAPDKITFYSYLRTLYELLSNRYLEIYTSDSPMVVYRCLYSNCTQFTQFNRGIATFSLKLTETDPSDRSVRLKPIAEE